MQIIIVKFNLRIMRLDGITIIIAIVNIFIHILYIQILYRDK
jgi:hypothetical protein